MHLAIMTTSHGRDGAGVMAHIHGRALRQHHHDVSYIVPQGTPMMHEVPIDARAYPITPTRPIDLKVMFQVAAGAHKLKPDILISHMGLSAVHTVAAAKIGRIPHFLVMHGEGYKTLPRRTKGLKILPRIADGFISVSPSLVDGMVEAGAARDKIRVVENFVDFDIPLLQPRQPHNAPIIGYLGRFHQAKGPERFIEVLAALKQQYPDVRAAIGGEGDMEAGMRTLAQTLGVADSIEWAGWVQNRSAFFNSIDILVLPSKTEGFGMVILEAWAHGVPVVSTNTVGPAKLISHGTTGLITAHDAKDIAGAVNTLLSDPDFYDHIAQTAHKAVHGYHASTRGTVLNDAVLDLYQQTRRRSWILGGRL